MTIINYRGLKHGKSDEELSLLADIQNDWIEITHTNEVSQVMNKTTGKYIIVKRGSLSCELLNR